MKDRTPKYPGRVKLEPVAGQTNIFDMTRADEPDDTGTPFNTRTMLQDSTGRFLKLPYANPLVDDALRHMPDRIEPIGTVKTSPAFSLGDAWLPCDGSQVTFAEYPQLCQLLRGTASVEFDAVSLGVSGQRDSASDIVYFAGKWWMAMCKDYVDKGTNYLIYPVTILCADSVEGSWAVDYTVNKWMYSTCSKLYMAATDEICVLALRYTEDIFATEKIAILYRRSTEQEWTFLPLTDYHSSVEVIGLDVHDGVFALAYGATTAMHYATPKVMYSSTPDVASSWETVELGSGLYAQECGSSFAYANGFWVYADSDLYTSGNVNLRVAYSRDNVGFQFKKKTISITGIDSGVSCISKTVFYSGKYYVLLDGFVADYHTQNDSVLATTTDFENWEFQSLKTNQYAGTESSSYRCALCASEKTMVIATFWQSWSTSDPSAQVNKATLPAGFNPVRACFDGDKAIIVSASSVAYHDFSTDTRLLPTISLSDDTTTYIKAKNELDVFEAGGG